MRDIAFQEVGMENYGPYKDPMILTFNNDTITLIVGPNGIGKTMAIDAIPFTLYGVTSKGAKGDDVVNNQVGKNCKTWVKFKVNDDQYLVTRYHKYTKYQNTVIVNQNGVDIKQGHKEALPFIERLVCPQKAFMNALMFGQKVKDFFTDLVDSKKKEIFRKIIDLEIFVEYYKQADLSIKSLKESIEKVDRNREVNIGLLKNAQDQIELLKKAKNDFYNNREEKIREKQKSIEESNRLLDKWTQTLKDLENKDTKLEETAIKLSEIEHELKDLADTFKKRFDELDNQKKTKLLEIQHAANKAEGEIKEKINGKLNEIREQKSDIRQKASDQVSNLNNKKHELQLSLNDVNSKCRGWQERIDEIITHVIEAEVSECPLCEQQVSKETLKTLEEKTEKYKKSIEEGNNEAKVIEEKIEKVEFEIKEVVRKKEEDVAQLENQESEIKNQQEDEFEKISNKLQSACDKVEKLADDEEKQIVKEENEKSYNLLEQKNELLEKKEMQEENLSEIESAKENIRNIQSDINQAERQIKELNESEYDDNQLKNYIKNEVQYNEKIMKSEEKLAELGGFEEVTSFWKTGFSPSGIPSMLIDEAIPYMNEKVDYYLDMLTNGRYVVSFDTLGETKAGEFRDKISVRVLDTQTRANSRLQLSGGQTRIIDIAIILTLGDLLARIQDMKFNIFLFDEIFDALDEQNIQYVSKVLNKLKVGKSIYIISHQHQDHLEPDESLAFS